MNNRLNLLKGTATLLFSVVAFVMVSSSVNAQGFLPDPIQNIFNLLGPGGEGTSEFVQSRISSLLLIFLGLIILLAVVYTAMAALKYIRSQGDEGEVETARKGIEAIFQGIAVMLIAIVGIVLIFVFFGAELFSPSLYQTCIAAANSPGCNACTDTNGGLEAEWEDAKFNLSEGFTIGLAPFAINALGAGFYPEYVAGGTTSPESELCGVCEWAYFQTSRDNPAAAAFIATGGPLENICTE